MTTRIDNHRQWQLSAVQGVAFDDILTAGLSAITIELPPGAIIVGGGVLVTTPSDAAGVAILDVGLTGAAADAFISDADLKTAAYTAFETGVGTFLPNGGTINLTSAANTDDTASALQVLVHYVVVGRGNEVQ